MLLHCITLILKFYFVPWIWR